MIYVYSDASKMRRKPQNLIGFLIFKENDVALKKVKEVNNFKRIKIDIVYLEFYSMYLALKELVDIYEVEDKEVIIFNDNISAVGILNSIGKNKCYSRKVEKKLKREIAESEILIKRFKKIEFLHISRKDNLAHKAIDRYRKNIERKQKREREINLLKIQQVYKKLFLVTTHKNNVFVVDLLNKKCTCPYFLHLKKKCKHIEAVERKFY